MFRVCSKCRIGALAPSRTFSSLQKRLPTFQEKAPTRNIGLFAGVGIATLGALYYLKSDEASYNDLQLGSSQIEVRRRVKSAYGYVLGGLTITSASAFAFYKAGLPALILRTNPWVYLGVSLMTSIPLVMGTQVIDGSKHPVQKHICWIGFNTSMAGGLSVIGLAGGPLVAQAALATGCVVGGLSLLASKAEPGSMQQFEAPLGMALGGVVALSLGNMIFPMPILHNLVLYGGLAVYSGLLVTDTQRMLENAERKQKFDPINESLLVYLDTLNIFQKIAMILMELENNKKR